MPSGDQGDLGLLPATCVTRRIEDRHERTGEQITGQITEQITEVQAA